MGQQILIYFTKYFSFVLAPLLFSSLLINYNVLQIVVVIYFCCIYYICCFCCLFVVNLYLYVCIVVYECMCVYICIFVNNTYFIYYYY